MVLFSIFLNQLRTAVVFFQCCSCNLFCNSLLMFSRITLLILPISFFAGMMGLAVVFFPKFLLWSFNVITQTSLPLTWIFSRMFFLLALFFFTLLVDGFSVFGIFFRVGLACRVKKKLLVYGELSLFGAFFCKLLPAFALNMETYWLSPRIQSECGVIRAKPTLNEIITSKITPKIFHAFDVRTLLPYFNTIVLQTYGYKLAE